MTNNTEDLTSESLAGLERAVKDLTAERAQVGKSVKLAAGGGSLGLGTVLGWILLTLNGLHDDVEALANAQRDHRLLEQSVVALAEDLGDLEERLADHRAVPSHGSVGTELALIKQRLAVLESQ